MKYLFFIPIFLISIIANCQILEVEGQVKIDQLDTTSESGLLLIQQSDGFVSGKEVDKLPFIQKADTSEWPAADINVQGMINIGSNPVRTRLKDDYAYIIDEGSDDLKVIDIADPYNPTLTGFLALGARPSDIRIQANFAYVVDRSVGDVKVINIDNPTMPQITGDTLLPGVPWRLAVQGACAYVACSGSKDLKIVDINNPTMPTTIGNLMLGKLPQGIDVNGNHVYIVESETDSLFVIDVSDPVNPNLIGACQLPTQPRDIVVQGDYAYVISASTAELYIIDVLMPAGPVIKGNLGLGSNMTALDVQGIRAYVTDLTNNRLRIVDISDPLNPMQIASKFVGDFPTGLTIRGNFAFITDRAADVLSIVELSDLVFFAVDNSGFMSTISSNALNHWKKNGNNLAYNGGNVGIGTATPTKSLEVVGGAKIDGNTFNVDDINERVGIGTASPTETLDVDGGASIDDSTFYVDVTSHRIGLGVSTPLKKLDIRGDMLLKTSNQGPRLHFAEDDGSVISIHYNAAGDDLRFQVRSNNGNTYVDDLVRFESDGEIYFKDDTDLYYLDKIVGYNDLRLYGADGQGEAFRINDVGDVRIPSLPMGNHGNMQYEVSTGRLFYDSSSKRFKENISTLEVDFMKILEAEPKTYTRPGRPDRYEIGYIAEEMKALGLDELVGLDQEGRPQDFNYGKMVLYLNEVNKSQQKEIKELKEKLIDVDEKYQQLIELVEALRANSH